MRELTREQAEYLIDSSEVVQSSVDYEHNDLKKEWYSNEVPNLCKRKVQR